MCGGPLALLCMWAFHMYISNHISSLSLINLSHVNLIIRAAERTLRGGGKWLPPYTMLCVSKFGFFILHM